MLYSYNHIDFKSNDVDTFKLHKEIVQSDIQTQLISVEDNTDSNICNILFAAELLLSEVNILNTLVSNHDTQDIVSLKCKKFREIDKRTNELIEGGFVYNSKTFSASINAQNRIMGIHQIKDDPALVYPIKWNTIDDNDYYELIDANDVHTFYLTALGTYRSYVDSGTALKDQVRLAQTKAEIDAIIDDR